MTDIITPAQVERRLLQLNTELDNATLELSQGERQYHIAKTDYEIAVAKARMKLRQASIEAGTKLTVGEIEDQATLDTRVELTALSTAEAVVKASRANLQRVRTQVDIARSIGTSVRTSIESA